MASSIVNLVGYFTVQLLNITVQLLNIAVQLENNCTATNGKIYAGYAIMLEILLSQKQFCSLKNIHLAT